MLGIALAGLIYNLIPEKITSLLTATAVGVLFIKRFDVGIW